MTNRERAETIAMTVCVLRGLVVRKSAGSVREAVRWGLSRQGEVETAILEWLDEQNPVGDDRTLAGRIIGVLDGGRALRRAQIAEELGESEDAVAEAVDGDGRLTINTQGWVRVAEATG